MCCKVVVIPRPGPNYRKRKAVRLRRREDICVVKVRGVWACTRRDGECCGSATWSAGRRSVKKGDGDSTSDLSTERRARCGGHGVYMYLPSYGGNGGNTDIHDLKGHFQRQALAASGLPLLAANPPCRPLLGGPVLGLGHVSTAEPHWKSCPVSPRDPTARGYLAGLSRDSAGAEQGRLGSGVEVSGRDPLKVVDRPRLCRMLGALAGDEKGLAAKGGQQADQEDAGVGGNAVLRARSAWRVF